MREYCHILIFFTFRGLIRLQFQLDVDIRVCGAAIIIREELLVSEVPHEQGCEVVTLSKVVGAVN